MDVVSWDWGNEQWRKSWRNSWRWAEIISAISGGSCGPASDQAKAGRNTGMGLMVETAQRQVESKL
jgi:hypothetical protein